jgi:hypothetical protein
MTDLISACNRPTPWVRLPRISLRFLLFTIPQGETTFPNASVAARPTSKIERGGAALSRTGSQAYVMLPLVGAEMHPQNASTGLISGVHVNETCRLEEENGRCRKHDQFVILLAINIDMYFCCA